MLQTGNILHKMAIIRNIDGNLISFIFDMNKCKPPLATPRGKLRLHVKLIQAEEQK